MKSCTVAATVLQSPSEFCFLMAWGSLELSWQGEENDGHQLVSPANTSRNKKIIFVSNSFIVLYDLSFNLIQNYERYLPYNLTAEKKHFLDWSMENMVIVRSLYVHSCVCCSPYTTLTFTFGVLVLDPLGRPWTFLAGGLEWPSSAGLACKHKQKQ